MIIKKNKNGTTKVVKKVEEEEEEELELQTTEDVVDEEEDSEDIESIAEEEDSDEEEETSEPEDAEEEEEEETSEPEEEEEPEEVEKPVKKAASKKPVKKAAKKEEASDDDEYELAEPEEEENEEETEEEEKKPTSPSEKKHKFEMEMIKPVKGKRMFKDSYATSKTGSTSRFNREVNLQCLVNALKKHGFESIVEEYYGNLPETKWRVLASQILDSVEEAVLDSIFNENAGFGFMNGSIQATHVKTKLYPAIKEDIKYDTLKREHHVLTLKDVEFNKRFGLLYNNEGSGSSEMSVKVEKTSKGYKAMSDALNIKKGDLLNEKGQKLVKKAK